MVTTRTTGGQALGVTISSFCSVSLEPPLILFCLGKNTRNFDSYSKSQFFAVNILGEDQIDLSENFASQCDDKFHGISFGKGENEVPILPGCVANLECNLVQTHDGGDHLILIGQVNRLQAAENGAPLLRYRGRYANLE